MTKETKEIQLDCVICGAEATCSNNTLCEDCFKDTQMALDDQEDND